MRVEVGATLLESLLGLSLLGLVLVLAAVVWWLARDRARVTAAARRREADVRAQREAVERSGERLADREDRLAAEAEALERRAGVLAEAEQGVADREARLVGAEQDARAERAAALERVAGLDVAQARAEVVARAEDQARLEVARRVRELERRAVEEQEWQARRVLATVVQRLATTAVHDAVTTTVTLSGDDVKGRIIGREGRNIRSFEQVTGVNLVVDDTPGAVLLSCFDPVRREVARVALEALVTDGRIHPARIEEEHGRAAAEVERLCRKAAEDACTEVGVTGLHPELLTTLGHLRLRTSYGQQVLAHLVESAHAARMLAEELGVDPAPVVRGAFLHDIGKALTHEVEGSHALVGAALARRCGEDDDVVHAIEAHHNEVEPRTVEAFLTQAADAISGGRPGARREPTVDYQDRLRSLERIATGHPGVEKAYAMSAGRDLRVMVRPEEVDDLAADHLAQEIAKEIEAELTYPGQITVTVVRESRATRTAR